MKYLAVTACASGDWEPLGRKMAETFRQHWPSDVILRIYAQGFRGNIGGVDWRDLHAEAPWLGPWRKRLSKIQCGKMPAGGGAYNFRFDAYRFAPKVAALAAATLDAKGFDVLIWIDADVITHANVTTEWLNGLFPEPYQMAWLWRKKLYPETSFMLFRPPGVTWLFDRMVDMYLSGELFQLKEWHDAYALLELVQRHKIEPLSLTGEGEAYNNAFANSPLAERMDHLKGWRKQGERTPKEHRKLPGGGAYWA